jgi:exopolyphosphatase / guanosine-5'-triphosphate,3'-diphosphate pyrophosphatase
MSRVAAIDCGTNSIRLLVTDITTGEDGTTEQHDVHREMRIVRLGQGVDASGELAPEALDRTRAALVDYAEVIRREGAERVRMVATSATRDAGNRDAFFGMVKDTLGIDAEVISGDEEANLSFVGAVGDLDPDDGPFVVVDVGGGSTELVLGALEGGKATVQAARSVDVGSVRLTERCLAGDPPSGDEVAEARRVATGILDEAFDAVPVEGVRTWVGVAGTITTLSAVALGLEEYDAEAVHHSRLENQDLHRVADELLGMSREERKSHGAIHSGRIDVIGAGALIVDVLARELNDRAGVTAMVVSEHDILDGIARSIA